jgi:hypothetical protein
MILPPQRAINSAQVKPIPLAPPVTTVVVPLKSNVTRAMSFSCFDYLFLRWLKNQPI